MEKIIIDLTQEQINTMVHDSCVLFCKYCGCGIPRETCTSLGTCKEHDEYRAAIRTRFMEKKKKEYPKTYEECCKILGILNVDLCFNADYRSFDDSKEQWKRLGLMNQFYQLLICRDAYWKISGEEMGLGKPWEPSGNEDCFVVSRSCGEVYLYSSAGDCEPFEFPTAKMRDAFYDNFKSEIEQCKELL